jgi:hypothetical protein
LIEPGDSLLKINNMDPIALGKDVGLHLGVPAPGPVAKVDPCFKQGFHGYNRCISSHYLIPPFWFTFVRSLQPFGSLVSPRHGPSVGKRVNLVKKVTSEYYKKLVGIQQEKVGSKGTR